jgi:NAD(P)-dependent dehydrogenase (short-subunit alcohol dehydrogenase family)
VLVDRIAMQTSTTSSKELDGQVAIVTGSSSGIGRATALALASAGADLVVHAAHQREGVDATAKQVRDWGQEAIVVMADFYDPAQVHALAEQSWNWRGGVDILVNNAGAEVLMGSAAKAAYDEKLHRLWQIDVLGSIRLARSIGQRMQARGRGVIVNIGWDQVDSGMAGDTGELFATTKGAVTAFTRSLAKSLAPQVRVNCVAPGWIKTAWGESASQAWQERAKNESLLARWGTPEDVAQAIRFIASPQASFVTGQVISVNGGRV